MEYFLVELGDVGVDVEELGVCVEDDAVEFVEVEEVVNELGVPRADLATGGDLGVVLGHVIIV